MTQPPLRSHSAWHNVTISHFTKAKELIIPPFQFSKTKDHRPNNTQAEALTWWMSSVKITANWRAEDRELQESSTGQQPRRLLMYWFGGLWNVDNLCHTFISFLWLSLVPSDPGPPQQNKQRLLLSQASINALCSRCHAWGNTKHIKASNWHVTSQHGFPNFYTLCAWERVLKTFHVKRKFVK